jgi:hypothetical protein
MYEAAILLRPTKVDASPELRQQASKLFEDFNAGYTELEGPDSYHLALGLMEVIGIKLAQNPESGYTECSSLVQRCLRTSKFSIKSLSALV